MAAALPFLAYLDELRALQGEPKVTNVYGDTAYSTTERVYNVYRSDVAGFIPGTSKEPNTTRWPNHFLVELHELDGNETHVNLYLKYERLPGLEITAPHYNNALGTEGITYTQRVAYGTPCKPSAALRIVSVGTGNPATVTIESQHDLPVGTTSLYLAGIKGSTPTLTDGIYVATRTGATTFTIPINVTVGATANTGYASPLYNGQVIVDSSIENDGAITSTLTTITALLPGRRASSLSWAAGGIRRKRTEQTTYHGTELAGGTNLEKEEIAIVDTAQARQIKETLVDANGIALADGDGEYTMAVRDGRTRVTIYTTFRVVAASYTLPLENSVFKTGRVLDARLHEIQGSPNCIAEIDWLAVLPLPRAEYPSLRYDFPGTFVQLQEWWNLDNIPGPARRPYPGIDIDYDEPKGLTTTGREIVFYTHGPSPYMPKPFYVDSPGAGSRTYPFIRPNTIHPPIVSYYIDSVGDAIKVENLEASTPDNYDAYDILTGSASSVPWKGRVFENRIMQVSEAKTVLAFPPIYVSVAFNSEDAAGRVDLLQSMTALGWPTGARLYVASSSAADTSKELIIFGRTRLRRPGKHFQLVTESVFTDGTLGTSTVKTQEGNWYHLYSMQLQSACAGTVTVSIFPSQLNFGGVTFPSGVNSADTLTITHKLDGVKKTKIYTFVTPGQIQLTVDDKASIADSDYFSINGVNDKAVFFWFDVTGTGAATAPALAAGERAVLIDITDAAISSSADVYEEVINAIYNDVTADGYSAWSVQDFGGDTMLVWDKFLGARAVPALGAGLGGSWAISQLVAGTAAAARQIRIRPSDIVLGVTIGSANTHLAEDLYVTLTDAATAVLTGAAATGTPDLSYLAEAEFSQYGNRVGIADAPGFDATWTLAQAGSGLMTLTAVTAGSDATTIATFPPGALDAYPVVDFFNPHLTESNCPALTTGYSGAVAVGGSGCILYLAARDTPKVVIYYQTSLDGVSWSAAAHGDFNLSGGIVHRYVVPETTNYIRIHFDNSLSKVPRAVHAVIDIFMG